jgi:hypothetical protein
MKEKKIEIIKVVDENDNTVNDLFAIESGTRPRLDVTTKAVYDFLGDYQNDGDENCYQLVINALCRNESIEMFGYTFFFEKITLFEL